MVTMSAPPQSRREHEAGIGAPPVDQNGAGAALAAVAALFRPGQAEVFAQEIE